MYDEPDQPRDESAADPVVRAREKADELRIHAELASVFEGCRKFDAELHTGLDAGLAREVQQAIGRLERAKNSGTAGPILFGAPAEEAAIMLDLPRARQVATCDYHVHRRPGEVMIIRWLAGEQVETFYERFQDHFDVALSTYRQEERSANEWRQDPPTLAYLDELDKVQQRMSDWYLRDVLRRHGLFAISTTTADEIDILHLCNHLMGVPASRLVGAASAPPEDEPTEQERAWFFKLFSLRGMTGGAERMCFFAFLQKTGEGWD